MSSTDIEQVPRKTATHNCLGFALQLCALRYPGFCPDNLEKVPGNIVAYLAEQLGVTTVGLDQYGRRSQTRSDYFRQIIGYLGFSKASNTDLQHLSLWLEERTLEHDNPLLLLELAIERLHLDKVVRPGLTTLERIVSFAKEDAYKDIFYTLSPILDERVKSLLDSLLVRNKTLGRTPLSWLRYGSVGVSPRSILESIEKLSCLRRWGMNGWDLSVLPPLYGPRA